jgi:hypothetical protein
MYADNGICFISLTTVRFVHGYWGLLFSAIIVTATCSVDLDSAKLFCCEVVTLVSSFSNNFDLEM